MTTKSVEIHEAQQHLAELVAQAAAGPRLSYSMGRRHARVLCRSYRRPGSASQDYMRAV